MIHWDNAGVVKWYSSGGVDGEDNLVESDDREQRKMITNSISQSSSSRRQNVFNNSETKGVKKNRETFFLKWLFMEKSLGRGVKYGKLGYFWCRKLQLLLMFAPTVPLVLEKRRYSNEWIVMKALTTSWEWSLGP